MAFAVGPGERVTLRGIAIPLIQLLAFGAALGAVGAAEFWARVFFGTLKSAVGWIPFAGKVIEAPIDKLSRKIISYLGSLAQKIDHRVARNLHDLATGLVDLFATVFIVAAVVYALANYIATKIHPLLSRTHQKTIIVKQTIALKRIDRLEERVHRLQREVEHPATGKVGVGVKTQTAPIAHELDWFEDWTIPKVKALEHAIATPFPRIGVRDRARTAELERTLGRLGTRVHGLEKRFGVYAFAGLLFATLARFGMGWLRCGNWRRIGPSLCKLDTGLIRFLAGDALEALIVSDLCDFVNALGLAAERFEPALIGFVDVEDALIGCHGATKAPDLALTSVQLPAVNAGMPLAA